MTRLCCPNCRLRFTPAVAVMLDACPRCHEPLQPIAGAAGTLGFRLFRGEAHPAQPLTDGTSAATPVARPERTMGDWNIRLLRAAIQRTRDQEDPRRPLQDG